MPWSASSICCGVKDAVAAVRRLADCYPQALYSAGIDPNELEIALSNAMVDGGTAEAKNINLGQGVASAG